MKTTQTTFLTSARNFLVGFGSVLDISASDFSHTYSKIKSRSDQEALASDWKAVGQSFNHILTHTTSNNVQPQLKR